MKTKVVLVGLCLAASISTGAYAQTNQFQVVPQGVPQINPASPISSQSGGYSGVNLTYYSQWCDQANRILERASSNAKALYDMLQFSEAKKLIEDGFNDAIKATADGIANGPGGRPGTFRPYTYQELGRSVELIQYLEDSTNFPSQGVKDKAITYVALNRASFVEQMAGLDRTYVVPCAAGCRERENHQFLAAFEERLVQIVLQQLKDAQNYSTKEGPTGVVYPLINGDTYFTIIGMTAQWAASDLTYANFSSEFACAIFNLAELPSYENDAKIAYNEPNAVQKVSAHVDDVIDSLSTEGYGCGFFKKYHDDLDADQFLRENRHSQGRFPKHRFDNDEQDKDNGDDH